MKVASNHSLLQIYTTLSERTGNLFIKLQLSFCVTKYLIPAPTIICGSWAE